MIHQDTVVRNRHYRNLEYDHNQAGDICLVACGIERCDPGITFGPDLRDCWHLHAVLSGKGTLTVNGKMFSPHFGQLFLLKDNEVVEYTADRNDPWEYCWVTFNGRKAEQLVCDIGFTEGIYCLDSQIETNEFYKLVLRMHEKPEMNHINDLRRRGILLEYLALAMEATETRLQKQIRRNEIDSKIYVDRAIDFIHDNYATIRVSDIMEYVGFTRSYFSTLFRKQIGMSPQEYLMQYRLKKACEQLTFTDFSIQLIAHRIGYEDQLAFSKLFHKAFGISPSEYRKQYTAP